MSRRIGSGCRCSCSPRGEGPDLPSPRGVPAAVAVGDRIYALGGYLPPVFSETVWLDQVEVTTAP